MTEQIKILDQYGQPMTHAGNGTLRKTGVDPAVRDWNPHSKSADMQQLPRRKKNIARIRDLVSGNGFAAAGTRRNNVNIIGSGLRLDYAPKWQALGLDPESPEAQDFIEAVETEFLLYALDIKTGADHTARTHLGGLARQAFTHFLEDGEVCTNVIWARNRRRRYQTQIQNIDPDRLSNPTGGIVARGRSGNIIKDGVEQTTSGAPIAYHVREQHESEAGYHGVTAHKWRRIERYMRGTDRLNFIHYFSAHRAGQTRGQSPLTSVLEKFKKLDVFQDSTLKAAIISAMFSFVIESPFDESLIGDQLSRSPTSGDPEELNAYQALRTNFHKTHKIELGDTKPIMTAPGEVLKPLMTNRPSPEYAGFVQSFMEEMAAANGMSLEQYTGNWTQTNYSSARAALNEAWKIMKVERDEFARHWYAPIFELWLEEAIDKGHIVLPAGTPGFYEMRTAWLHANWIGPGRGYVDPVKEAQAAGMRMALMTSNVKKEAAEQGDDYKEILRQTKREAKEFDAAGHTHPSLRNITAKSALHKAQVPDAGSANSTADDQETNEEAIDA